MNDPPIPKCGNGAHHDSSSAFTMLSYESKGRAIFDVLLNFFIAVTIYFDLMSFIQYNNGTGPMGMSLASSIFFLIEMIIGCNAVYRDDSLKLIVAWCTPWTNWIKTWAIVDVLAYAGVIMSMMNKTVEKEYVIYNQNNRYWKLFELLRLLKLLSIWRMKRIACSFSGDPRKPHKTVLTLLKIFAGLVLLMTIVLGILAAMNAGDVQKKIDSIPYTDLPNLWSYKKPK